MRPCSKSHLIDAKHLLLYIQVSKDFQLTFLLQNYWKLHWKDTPILTIEIAWTIGIGFPVTLFAQQFNDLFHSKNKTL
jgi:hypothetical protein